MLFSGQHLSGHKICQVCGWSWIPSCLHCQQSTAMPCFGKVSCGTSTLPASRCSNHGLFDGIQWFGETGHGKSDSLFRSSDIYSRLFVFLPNQSCPIDTTVGLSTKKWHWDYAGKGAVRQVCKTLESRKHKISGNRCTSILQDPFFKGWARADNGAMLCLLCQQRSQPSVDMGEFSVPFPKLYMRKW